MALDAAPLDQRVRTQRDRIFNIAERDGAYIEQYVTGGRETFFRDRMVQDAVIRNFEVMGEAVKRLSADLRRQQRRCSLAANSRVSRHADSWLFAGGCG